MRRSRMDMAAYFRSLSSEIQGLAGRVRNFIGDAHRASEGEWKESVLRSAIRRCAPTTTGVGRGFLVAPETASRQIDVLIWSNREPAYFRDGDFVLIPPQFAQALIEVKASVTRPALEAALEALVANKLMIPEPMRSAVVSGLFVYQCENIGHDDVLDLLEATCRGASGAVNLVCLGPHLFVRYWAHGPGRGLERVWHSYDVRERAYGYFLHNVLEALSATDAPWFPAEGKEPHLRAYRQLPERYRTAP